MVIDLQCDGQREHDSPVPKLTMRLVGLSLLPVGGTTNHPDVCHEGAPYRWREREHDAIWIHGVTNEHQSVMVRCLQAVGTGRCRALPPRDALLIELGQSSPSPAT